MTADEMFRELGYKKIENKLKTIYVEDVSTIEFILDHKKIEYHFLRGNTFYMQNIRELQAINQKCKELGWLDE